MFIEVNGTERESFRKSETARRGEKKVDRENKRSSTAYNSRSKYAGRAVKWNKDLSSEGSKHSRL